MDQNPIDALFGSAEEPPAVAETPAAEPAPPTPASADAPASEAGDTEAPLSKRELHGILNATLAERDKRQALEKELAELKASLPQREAPVQTTPEQRLADQVARLQAEVRHGPDKVETAFKWAFDRCAEDPLFNSRAAALIQQLGSPYEAAVALRKEVDDLDALKNPAPATPEPAAQAVSPPPPPRTLADAPNAGGSGRTEVPIGPGEAFKAAIG